jgi:hypothetical protein
MLIWFIYFYAAVLKRKINTKFLLAFMKTKKHLLNLKIVPKAASEFLNPSFLLSHWSIFSNVCHQAAFRIIFRTHIGSGQNNF